MEMMKGVPGRSPCHTIWKAIGALRQRFDAICSEAERHIDLTFEWVPRRFNQFADHLCNAALDDVRPTFESCVQLEVPTTIAAPSIEDLQKIADRARRGEMPNTWKSITPALRVTWHAILSQVAEWDNPWAIYLAPVVLLQRHADSPVQRLARMAATPGLIQSYYWHAANDELTQRPAQEA